MFPDRDAPTLQLDLTLANCSPKSNISNTAF
jgi:hypothetical protein